MTYSDTAAGSPTITASYGGDTSNGPSTGTFSLTVAATVTTTVTVTVTVTTTVTITRTVTSYSTVTYTSTATPPPPTSGSITVYVYGSGGKPVSGTVVSLSGPSTRTLTTSSGVEAQFSCVPLASYTLSATVDGAHLSAPVSLTTSNSQATVVLEPSPSGGRTLLDYGIVAGGMVAAVGAAAFLLLRTRHF